VFNQYVYGDPLTTGFHLGKELIAETVNFSHESFLLRRPEVLLHYLRLYGTAPVIALPVAACLASAVFFAVRARGAERALAAVTLAVVAILFLYYGQQDAWGYESVQLSASILRYMLPGFALLTVFGAGAASRAAGRWGWGIYAVPAMLFGICIWQMMTAPGGVSEMHKIISRSTDVQEQVVAATEPDAVIASRIMDKVIFPQRQTMTLTYAMRNEEPLDKGNRETWDFIAGPDRFAHIAAVMAWNGIPFYLLNDVRIGPLEPYQAALREQGLTFQRVPEVTRGSLWRVALVSAQ
jgi:hypothetical protein